MGSEETEGRVLWFGILHQRPAGGGINSTRGAFDLHDRGRATLDRLARVVWWRRRESPSRGSGAAAFIDERA